jgi:SUN domain-containing protein 1/2
MDAQGAAGELSPADWQHEEAKPAAEADEADQEGLEQKGCGSKLAAAGSAAAALGRRLQALLPAPAQAKGWQAAAAALAVVLLLAALVLGSSHAWAASRRAAASQASQLASLHRQLAELQSSLQQLGAREQAASTQLQQLRQAHSGQAGELAVAQSDIAHLQLQLAAARNASSAADTMAATSALKEEAAASLVGAASSGGQQHLRQLVQEEVGEALEAFAADRTGLVDYALAGLGGTVVAHSPTPPPATSAWFPARAGALHPQANQVRGWDGCSSAAGKPDWGCQHAAAVPAPPDCGSSTNPACSVCCCCCCCSAQILHPSESKPTCLPLAGSSGGWVEVRLSRPIHPTAFTYEHPLRLATNLAAAPRIFSLTGYRRGVPGDGGSAAGLPLGNVSYDAHGRHAVQTFQLGAAAATGGGGGDQQGSDRAGEEDGLPLIDHVRLTVSANHGHPDHTCLHRIRVHGTTAAAD